MQNVMTPMVMNISKNAQNDDDDNENDAKI